MLFGIIGLSDSRIEFVAARGVVALKFVVDFGRSAEGVLKKIGTHQRRRAIHLVELIYLIRDVNPLGVVVEFLFAKLGAEYRLEFALR